jgi:hypothetical protein
MQQCFEAQTEKFITSASWQMEKNKLVEIIAHYLDSTTTTTTTATTTLTNKHRFERDREIQLKDRWTVRFANRKARQKLIAAEAAGFSASVINALNLTAASHSLKC